MARRTYADMSIPELKALVKKAMATGNRSMLTALSAEITNRARGVIAANPGTEIAERLSEKLARN